MCIDIGIENSVIARKCVCMYWCLAHLRLQQAGTSDFLRHVRKSGVPGGLLPIFLAYE